jgi:hypothetical protein
LDARVLLVAHSKTQNSTVDCGPEHSTATMITTFSLRRLESATSLRPLLVVGRNPSHGGSLLVEIAR